MRRDPSARRSAYFATSPLVGWLLDQRRWPWLFVGSLAIFVFALMRWLAIVPIAIIGGSGAGLLWWMLRYRHVWAWKITASGLVEQYPDGKERRHPWDKIQEVGEAADAVVVVTSSTTLRYAGRAKDRALLAQTIRDRLARRSGERVTIPPALIAGWLDIGLDDSIRLGRTGWQRALLLVGMAGFWAAVYVMSRRWFGDTFLWFMTVYFTFDVVHVALYRPVVVTPYGLKSGKVRISWDEVEGCVKGPGGIVVSGRRTSVPLVGPQAQRVAAVVEQVLEARQSGAVLPRMGDVSDHAISRAESVEVDAGRGISPTDRETS